MITTNLESILILQKYSSVMELKVTPQIFRIFSELRTVSARAAFETQQEQYDAALYDWDEALRLAPKNAELTASKVDVLLRLGRKKEAREALDQAVKQGTPRAALREWYDKCK